MAINPNPNPNPVPLPPPAPLRRQYTTTKYHADPAVGTLINGAGGFQNLTPAQRELAYRVIDQRYS